MNHFPPGFGTQFEHGMQLLIGAVYGVSGGPWGVRPNVGGIVGVYLSGGRG